MEPQKEILKFKKRPQKKRLNKRTVEGIDPPSTGKLWIYDSQTPKLAICITANGTKSWFWVGRFGRSMIRLRLGGFPEISPERAAKLASAASADVSEGKDPRDAKRRLREEWTLGELFAEYLEKHAKPHKRTWLEDEQSFDRYCGRFKGRRISDITKADIINLHSTVGNKHGKVSANRLLTLLSGVFDFGSTIGCEVGNPTVGIRRFKEQSRERFLSFDELRRFLLALGHEEPLWQDFFQMLLLTGVRRSNLESMRFAEVDFAAGVWRIPGEKFKNGELATIPLSSQALEILETRRASVEGEWVFPSGRKGQTHIREPRVPWERIIERAGIEDFTMHDARRTMASVQAGLGASVLTIAKSLGHKSTASTGVYARLDMDPVRLSVEAAAAAMLATAKGGGA